MEISPATDQIVFNAEKFRELLVYVSKKCEDDPTFGAVKLNKILYYADFAAYRLYDKPVTGAKYRKLSEGPAPRELILERDALVAAGDAEVREAAYFTGTQKRLTIKPGRQANREIFEPRELALVDEIIDFFLGKTAREVSDFSHREPGWALSKNLAVIPYETAWLSANPLPQEIEESLSLDE